jgi:hyaluronate lyase
MVLTPLKPPPKIIAWVLLWLCWQPLLTQADEFAALRLAWQNDLLAHGGSASSVAGTADSYWSSLNTSPSRTSLWSDLPFGSVSANLVATYQRLQTMALAWAMPGSSLQNNAGLAGDIRSALDWMNTHVYTTTATEYNNWFHWEISGPQALNNTLILLYPALTGAEITNNLNAIDRFSPGGAGAKYGWMTGANTSDKALVVAVRGILGRNADKLASARDNLSPVFRYVTGGDGFYRDGSFVFHSKIAYNGHYGLVLLGDIPQLVNLLQGSTWQITDSNLTNVFNWVRDSFAPLMYHGALMDMVRGRAISWSYETEAGDGNGAISAARQIARFAPANLAVTLSNWANAPQLSPGQFHFPAMDRVVAIRSNFTFAISMSSSRIANYESINNGNLHGWFTGDGMTYLYLGNLETQFSGDFWPTVDPYHLPGTTVETTSRANAAGEAATTDQNWVGGAQVKNVYGVAGMSLHSWNTSLYGRKSWFMLDDEIVCLGAGITCNGPAEVHTVAENRRLGPTITNHFVLNGTAIAPVAGWSASLPGATASWCALGGVGGYYFPAGATNLQAAFQAASGSWSQINAGDSPAVYTDNYFTLRFNHGVAPDNSGYAYVILPAFSATSVSNYARRPDIVILTNSPQVQAVAKPSLGVVAANFWTGGPQSAGLISVNDKASVITLETSNRIAVGISDPTQTNGGAITVTLARAAAGLASADAGITVRQLSPQIIFSADVNGAHGQALQAEFIYSNAVLPSLENITPDGTAPFQSTNTLSFSAASAAGIAASNVVVMLNGIHVTNLVFNGSSNHWQISYAGLQPNQTYAVTIAITDASGGVATAARSFDTFSAAHYLWEAEDFDFGGGNFFDGRTNAYSGLSALMDVDSHQVKFGGAFLYRPNGMDTEINGDVVRSKYAGTGFFDYSLSYFGAGAWADYTRHFPAGDYHVYARLASGGSATTCELDRVTGGGGTTNQNTSPLGTFNVPPTAWETYSYIPLLDATGNLAVVSFSGAADTLRLARPAPATSDCNANFLMLVPVFATRASFDGARVHLRFPSQPGFNYQVQYKSRLTDAAWLPLAEIGGSDPATTFSEPPAAGGRFYRVLIH